MEPREYSFPAAAITRLVYLNKTFMIIDYSNSRENEMINRISILGDLVKLENKAVYLIAIFNDKSFATPSFMQQTELVTKGLGTLIENKALVGLNLAKKMILKGQNNAYNTNIKSFDTVEEAIQDLLKQPALVHAEQNKRSAKKIL